MRRLKLFSWAGDQNSADVIKAVGYQPIPLEPTDILTGLQTKLIEAVPTTPLYALVGQFYRPAPHMISLNWVPLVGGAVIAKKTWDSLSPETQEAMRKAAHEAGEEINKRTRIENDEAIEAMKKRGLTVHTPTPEVEAEWVKLAERTYPHIRGRIVPAATYDEVQRLLAEFRQRQTSAKP